MESGRNLRIMSANLWNTRVDAAAFAALVRVLDVDIVCTQELSGAAATALDRIYPYGDLDPRDDFSGMGISLRHPAKVRPLELFHKGGQIAELEPEDWPQLRHPLQIVNLHFAAPGPRRVASSLMARRRQLADFDRFIADDEAAGNRVLIGDFNSTPVWPLYRSIARQWVDLHSQAAAARGRRPRRTWGPTSASPRFLRIDHCFGEGVQAAAVWVAYVAGSDHSALIVDLKEAGQAG